MKYFFMGISIMLVVWHDDGRIVFD
ncbi:membrane protein YpdK [Yersinia enterocolitica]